MIKLKNISKTFYIKKKPFKILKKINLEVEKNEIFGLVGNTGCGKTTLLRIMSGFIQPDENNIIRKFDRLESAMIFQNFNLLNNLNVFENAALPLKLRNFPKQKIVSRINDLLEYVKLTKLKNAYPNQISGGQKQKISIIRALAIHPKIIFCDEPTSSLDNYASYEILKLIKEINNNFKTTIILVSHNISVIKNLCHRVAILEKGKITKEINLRNKFKDLKFISYEKALE
ncbi:ABC-type methionine transport system, ATPase component [Candidatus Phytoplasma mali]|uniref:ABC-type methionine transport system, ATPase component n=1 Tax=Phytoplasma mali (strain AT) TaxID=482235 RepID=B3R0I0_PHYMT|nr:ATP-binding cassette domain-containing protein [Candidatus Phytoplasma mali]CAP18344.1 ABC-type methionine transport system, ATPase component [Candidatus Phytoplasma mali]